jgi:hypothetical protein
MTLGIVRGRPDLEPRRVDAHPEPMLIRAYALTERAAREAPCACGGAIDATYRPVPEAVADHQGTLEHRAWRAAGGLG